MRKYYPGITLFKFAGAVMIVLAHIKPFPLNAVLNTYIPSFSVLCSVVVSGFYVMAGFLACKGWMHAAQPKKYIRQYVMWIGRVYALFCLLSFFTDPHSVVRTGSFAYRSLQFYIEPFLVVGPYRQLWFIPPLIVAIVLGYWAERGRRLVAAGALALLGFLVAASVIGPLQIIVKHMLGDLTIYRYKHWMLVQILVYNYLAYGFPFVFAGIFIAKWEKRFVELNKWWLLAPALLWSIAELAVIMVLYPGGYPHQMMLAHLPLTLLLFYGLLNVTSQWVQPYHGYLRRLSIVLFFAHWPLIHFNAWLLGFPLTLLSPGQTVLCIGLTFGQIILLERVIVWLQRKYIPSRGIALNS
ncbi:hypothetical protein DNI29_16945 [Hymenobacter sediminis]|uniref:acyltransferase family protein n=1 Tax=Hymenobacter sediminis TaxID=2218621 RepID=UPI000F505447|nr:acyltransferase family protein [Hymenobacter sediminis]RPD45836.1 hypothetical protein DNI29_16945 [Hymenobacter sediminis]